MAARLSGVGEKSKQMWQTKSRMSSKAQTLITQKKTNSQWIEIAKVKKKIRKCNNKISSSSCGEIAGSPLTYVNICM